MDIGETGAGETHVCYFFLAAEAFWALVDSLCCTLTGGSVKHTFVIFSKLLKPFGPWSLSLFQPKTATIEDTAIALVKIKLLAGWRNLRDI